MKIEFFDCETFIMTIDDLVVSLLDGVNYDKQMLIGEQVSGGNNNE